MVWNSRRWTQASARAAAACEYAQRAMHSELCDAEQNHSFRDEDASVVVTEPSLPEL